MPQLSLDELREQYSTALKAYCLKVKACKRDEFAAVASQIEQDIELVFLTMELVYMRYESQPDIMAAILKSVARELCECEYENLAVCFSR